MEPKNAKPVGTRVLFLDVETSANIAYLWGKYEQDALGEFLEERKIICMAWKWLGERSVSVLSLPMLKSYAKDPNENLELVNTLHDLLSEADIVVGHNIDEFDARMANVEFISHKMKPPHPYKTIDTLKVARTRFRFNSNKLDDLGAKLGLGRKIKHRGFDMWAAVMRGDLKAWGEMERYNRQDVVLLERIYLALRPWMQRHPNMNALDGRTGCPNCRSKNVIRQGWGLRINGRYRRYQCKDCGAWSTDTKLVPRS